METLVWTKDSNEQPQWLQSGFLNQKVGCVYKGEENNAADSQSKEQVITVAHAALEETATGSISPPDPPQSLVSIRLQIKCGLAAESEQYKLVNMTWP